MMSIAEKCSVSLYLSIREWWLQFDPLERFQYHSLSLKWTKQGCVLAPPLLALYFYILMVMVFENVRKWVRFEMITQTVRDLFFTDDCARVAHTLDGMQWIVKIFSSASKSFGLTIPLMLIPLFILRKISWKPFPLSPILGPIVSNDT